MGKRLKLGEMLVAKGLITEAQLASALGEQRRWGKRLGMTLVLMGYLEEETLIRTLAAQLKLPVARIRGKRVNAEVVELVPVELAEKHRCLPLFVKDQGGSRELFLAMEDPSDLDAQGELGFRIGFRSRPVLVAPTDHPEAAWVAGALRERGIGSVLLEGGPTVNARFHAARLIDELYWTVGPWLLGGEGLPMLAPDPPTQVPRQASLVSAHRHGDELFLRYRIGSVHG